ncbi:MAG: aminopeptidase [Firmicutes bacterium]|nr:aminopeptidase [Bacillota bacterium]
MVSQEQLKKYADLAVRVGVNIQPGQPLVIGYWNRPVLPPHIAFSRLLIEAGYDAGASFVQVDWGDEWWMRETVRRGSLDLLAARARWQAQWVEELAAQGAAYLAIPAADPDLYKGIDPALVGEADRLQTEAINPFNFRRTNNEYSWSLLSAPTQAWADKVHANLPPEQRVDALWEDILFCSRASGSDPVAAWEEHLQNLGKRRDWLNHLRIRSLTYRAPGTDLTITLPDHHFWAVAQSKTPAGVPFIANIPTEEVYSVPLKTGVDGVVTSTMPLNHGGALIEGMQLRFVGGRIVEYTAKSGLEALRHIIEMDEGSHFLGEVALVPVNSPIAERGRLFYNTLFDENASCHFAIGKAYALIEGGSKLPRSEWEAHGLNDSLMHVDFMVGSAQMDITATTQSGETVEIFRQGRWATPV